MWALSHHLSRYPVRSPTGFNPATGIRDTPVLCAVRDILAGLAVGIWPQAVAEPVSSSLEEWNTGQHKILEMLQEKM